MSQLSFEVHSVATKSPTRQALLRRDSLPTRTIGQTVSDVLQWVAVIAIAFASGIFLVTKILAKFTQSASL